MAVNGEGGIPWRSRPLYVILATTFIAVAGIPIVGPTLPDVALIFSVADSQASLLITLYSLPIIFFAPIIGMYSDRIGRKKILVACLTCFGLTGGSIAFVGVFELALILRFLQGASAAGLLTIAFTLVGDLYENKQINAVMGITGASMAAGAAVAPIVSGRLVSYAWNVPFFFFFSAVAVAVMALTLLNEPAFDAPDKKQSYLRQAIQAAPLRDALLLYGAVFIVFGILFGGIHTATPLVLDRLHQVDAMTIGLILALSPVMTAIAASQNGRIAGRIPNHVVIIIGMLVIATATLQIGVGDSVLIVAVSVALFGVGKGLAQPSIDAAVSGMVPAQFRAGAMSLRTTTKHISGTIWPVGVTSAGTFVAYPQLFMSIGVGIGLFALAMVVHFTNVLPALFATADTEN